MERKLLLINDMAGYGKVALSAMFPVMAKMGINTFNLPTALISNTFDYGKFDVLDTTSYIRNTLSIWRELGFTFNAISTGFIVNEEQAALISSYCLEQARKGITIFCDPIMADEGELYNGLTFKNIEYMRRMAACADFILPNATEAAFLSNIACAKVYSQNTVKQMIDAIRALGTKSVVITSMHTDEGCAVCCYDALKQEYFNVSYEELPGIFPGTGDIFASVFMGNMINGYSLKESVTKAVKTLSSMISACAGLDDRFRGIPVETCLDLIER